MFITSSTSNWHYRTNLSFAADTCRSRSGNDALCSYRYVTQNVLSGIANTTREWRRPGPVSGCRAPEYRRRGRLSGVIFRLEYLGSLPRVRQSRLRANFPGMQYDADAQNKKRVSAQTHTTSYRRYEVWCFRVHIRRLSWTRGQRIMKGVSRLVASGPQVLKGKRGPKYRCCRRRRPGRSC